jgi:DNA-binding transcriptional ArsR family regulator
LTPSEPLHRPALVQALAHPLRARMLYVLQERPASPKELSEEFDIPLANAAYHVQVLRKLKLIRLVKKTPRRGAVEHHYRADPDALAEDASWGKTAGLVKDAVTGSLLEEIGTQATSAAAAGGFARDDAQLARTRLRLDEEAWTELGGLLEQVLGRGRELEAESKKRLRRAGADAERHAGLVMMLFEAPPAAPGERPPK